MFIKKKKQPYYCYEDALELIMSRTGMSKNDILEVLKANDMYLKKIGVLDLSEEDIEFNYNFYKD